MRGEKKHTEEELNNCIISVLGIQLMMRVQCWMPSASDIMLKRAIFCSPVPTSTSSVWLLQQKACCEKQQNYLLLHQRAFHATNLPEEMTREHGLSTRSMKGSFHKCDSWEWWYMKLGKVQFLAPLPLMQTTWSAFFARWKRRDPVSRKYFQQPEIAVFQVFLYRRFQEELFWIFGWWPCRAPYAVVFRVSIKCRCPIKLWKLSYGRIKKTVFIFKPPRQCECHIEINKESNGPFSTILISLANRNT